ncbi:MAG TPA: sulfatase-like hydrolase/transferase [Cyclobacteriaceae bacterium]|nr:sulfatase-like hydrolase/transferase [Cyclobacteriaceae bacterium]
MRLLEDISIRENVYWGLVKRLLLVMGFYTICRISFYLFNISFFPDMTWDRMSTIMLGGLKFDLAAVLYLNSLFILLTILPLTIKFHPIYQKVLYYIFIITNGIGLAVNIADNVYYPYTLRRTTISVLSQFENEQNFGALFFSFLVNYWYGFAFFFLILYLFIRSSKQIKVSGPQLKNKWAYYGSAVVLMPAIIYLFVGGVRGGFRHSTRPITISNAAEFATIPKDINLVLNTPFALMRTARANVIEKVDYYSSEKALAEVYTPLHVPSDTAAFKYDNVVIIILESFSKEFVGAYNNNMGIENYKGYSPYIDSLISKSLAFQYSLSNGRKSIDAMPSVICSIPSIEVPFVLSHYSGNKVNSLASLLKEKGYSTSFFHGAPNGSMGLQAFANLSGFDKYYGMTEYDNDDDFDGIWGIWDEKFLQYFANTLNTFKEPFYSTLFTVTSHPPHILPEEYKDTFEGGPLPIHKTIEYTDYSVKRFMETASTMPWFKNTLFVFTADHATAAINYQVYNSSWGYYSIPLFFYHPGSDWSTFSDDIVQQIDIMPSVLGYLNYDKPYIAYGRNIFDPSVEPYAYNYADNVYQAFIGNYLLQYDGKKSVALYDFKNDKGLKSNLVHEMPEVVEKMEIKLKAFIQQYNNRMVDDNLTMDGPQSGPNRLGK